MATLLVAPLMILEHVALSRIKIQRWCLSVQEVVLHTPMSLFTSLNKSVFNAQLSS